MQLVAGLQPGIAELLLSLSYVDQYENRFSSVVNYCLWDRWNSRAKYDHSPVSLKWLILSCSFHSYLSFLLISYCRGSSCINWENVPKYPEIQLIQNNLIRIAYLNEKDVFN